jgi:hypothetical protein
VDPEEIDMVISQDLNGINAGSMFFRNSDTMRLTVELWSDEIFLRYAEEKYHYLEQALILHTILRHPQLLQRVGFLRQGLINAYATTSPDGLWDTWQEGELVVHFAACRYFPYYLC